MAQYLLSTFIRHLEGKAWHMSTGAEAHEPDHSASGVPQNPQSLFGMEPSPSAENLSTPQERLREHRPTENFRRKPPVHGVRRDGESIDQEEGLRKHVPRGGSNPGHEHSNLDTNGLGRSEYRDAQDDVEKGNDPDDENGDEDDDNDDLRGRLERFSSQLELSYLARSRSASGIQIGEELGEHSPANTSPHSDSISQLWKIGCSDGLSLSRSD